MAMVTCKECKQEMSSSVKKCPSCGKDQRSWFMQHKILSIIGVLVILSVLGGLSGGKNTTTTSTGTDNGTSSSTESSAPAEVVSKVGDVLSNDKFEITITSIEEKSKVGNEYLSSTPSKGGTYVVVNWQYKNISKEPINAFSCPKINLIDSNKATYNSDISASGYYATEKKLDSKVFSDLNPGITVKDADVFEVSKDLYKAGGFRLDINSGSAFININ